MDGYEHTLDNARPVPWRMTAALVTAATLALAGVAALLVVPASRPAAVLSAVRAAGLPVALPVAVPVDLAAPFAATPAAAWPDGIDGLRLPAATPVGDFSAAEVAAAAEQVRQLTAALNVDREVIEQRRFDRFLGLLSPSAREIAEPSVLARTENFPPYLAVVADGYRLLPAGPKTDGTMSVGPGTSRAELSVRVDLRVAYAFDPAGAKVFDPAELVVLRTFQLDFVVRRSPPFKATTAGIHVVGGQAFLEGAACRYARVNLIAPLFADRSQDACTT
ncbi:hypothetical protein L1857_11445 [Amycolatopsis thermalba]|uniref:Secreted protein n=1 Tax=Amycolatopsis thermalba TaxID=944492 RepID=A0ABY4NTK0_9PSEU|nr:hypothetical protein [Amycolatopsis thermalba]UQS23391.1 hypothetical protein L1857_11445 [Amycolatopsis thermalba]